MARVVETVTKRGTGRRDYSSNVEVSTVPVIRSYEEEYTYQDVKTVPANSSKVFHIQSEISGTEFFLYEIDVSAERNVLIRSALWDTVNELPVLHTMGYQTTEIKCSEGTRVSDIDIKIWNYSDKDLDVALYIYGMKYPTKLL